MGTNQDDEIEIDLKELFFVMRRKLWILILTGMLGAAICGIFTATMMKPVYTSSTMLYIVNKTTTLTSLTDLQLGSQLTKDYKVLITSRPVTAKVIENLDLNLDHEELLNKITVQNPQDTRILSISVNDNDPYMAKAIADEMATVAANRMAEIMDTVPPNIVEEGYVPTRQTSPSLMKNTAIGGMAGLFLAAMLVLILYIMNDSIKTPEDVEKYLGLTVLGTIPVFETGDIKRGKKKRSKRKTQKRKSAPIRSEVEEQALKELEKNLAAAAAEMDQERILSGNMDSEDADSDGVDSDGMGSEDMDSDGVESEDMDPDSMKPDSMKSDSIKSDNTKSDNTKSEEGMELKTEGKEAAGNGAN